MRLLATGAFSAWAAAGQPEVVYHLYSSCLHWLSSFSCKEGIYFSGTTSLADTVDGFHCSYTNDQSLPGRYPMYLCSLSSKRLSIWSRFRRSSSIVHSLVQSLCRSSCYVQGHIRYHNSKRMCSYRPQKLKGRTFKFTNDVTHVAIFQLEPNLSQYKRSHWQKTAEDWSKNCTRNEEWHKWVAFLGQIKSDQIILEAIELH